MVEKRALLEEAFLISIISMRFWTFKVPQVDPNVI